MSYHSNTPRSCLFVVILGISLVFILLSGSFAEDRDFTKNWVRFTADYDKVFFPKGISKLYFHTEECPNCKDSLPSWRFYGELLIDSIMRDGKIEDLTRESQVTGVQINSTRLLEVMSDFHAYTLERNRYATPYDTIKWSEVRQKYYKTSDKSKEFLFKIQRRGNIDSLIDSIISILKEEEDFENVLPPVYFIDHDGICAPVR